MEKKIETRPEAIRAAHRSATKGLDLRTRTNASDKGYTKKDRKEGKNIENEVYEPGLHIDFSIASPETKQAWEEYREAIRKGDYVAVSRLYKELQRLHATDRIDGALQSLEPIRKAIKDKAMIYQADRKEEVAKALGVSPQELDLPFAQWRAIDMAFSSGGVDKARELLK